MNAGDGLGNPPGPDQAWGKSHSNSSGGLSFPRFSSSSNCRGSTPSCWDFHLDPGKRLLRKRQSSYSFRPWAAARTGNTPPWQQQVCSKNQPPAPLHGIRGTHCQLPNNAIVAFSLTPSARDQHWLPSKAWNSDPPAFGFGRFWLIQATLSLKHRATCRAERCCLHYKWCSIGVSSMSKCFYCL